MCYERGSRFTPERGARNGNCVNGCNQKRRVCFRSGDSETYSRVAPIPTRGPFARVSGRNASTKVAGGVAGWWWVQQRTSAGCQQARPEAGLQQATGSHDAQRVAWRAPSFKGRCAPRVLETCAHQENAQARTHRAPRIKGFLQLAGAQIRQMSGYFPVCRACAFEPRAL